MRNWYVIGLYSGGGHGLLVVGRSMRILESTGAPEVVAMVMSPYHLPSP